MTAAGKAWLERLIAPVSLEVFFERHWELRALHVPGAPDRFASLYDEGRFWSGTHVAHLDAAIDHAGRHVQERIDPAIMQERFAGGWTLCGDVSRDPSVASLLEDLTGSLLLGAGEPPFAKVYASPEDGGFPLHTDPHHVFVLQIAGQKRWRFGATPALTAPPWGAGVSPSGRAIVTPPGPPGLWRDDAGVELVPPDPSALAEVVLQPGDCLYLPAGTWHTARAVRAESHPAGGGHSLAVSVSPPRAARVDVVLELLRETLARQATWRRDVVRGPHEGPTPHGYGRAASAFEEALGALRETLAHLDAAALQRGWLRRTATGAPNDSRRAVRPLAPQDLLERTHPGPLSFLVARSETTGGEVLFFYHAGAEWTLPVEALPFVEALCRASRFAAEDVRVWDPRLSWEAARETLTQLVQIGVLRVADDG